MPYRSPHRWRPTGLESTSQIAPEPSIGGCSRALAICGGEKSMVVDSGLFFEMQIVLQHVHILSSTEKLMNVTEHIESCAVG